MTPLYKLYSTLTLLLACMLLPAAAMGQTILDLTEELNEADHNGARFIQEDASEGAGTGILDPFARTKSNLDVVAMMNTGNPTVQFETEEGPWTSSLLLSTITDRDLGADGIFKEFILDINQTSGSRIYPMNDVQVWADNQSDLNCYLPYPPLVDPVGGGDWGPCDDSTPAVPVFWLDRDLGGSFPGTTGDATVIMDYDLESGSGNQTDIVMLLPLAEFPDAEDCSYGSLTCNTYIYVYSIFGKADECGTFSKTVEGAGNKTYVCEGNDDGFEEWSTLVEPFVNIDKDLAGSIDETHDWDLTKDVDATECDQFIGGECTFNYTVTVTEIETISATIGGTVTYSVPAETPGGVAALDANVTVTDDFYSGAGTLVWDDPTCAVGQQFTLGAGESKVCIYSVTGGEGDAGPQTNSVTATVEFNDGLFTAMGSATIGTNLTGPPAVDVTDTIHGPLGSGITSGAVYNYPEIYECSSEPGDYTDGSYSFDVTNVAEIIQTGDDDTETVTVNCYAPVVSKTGAGSYDENYDWDIDKSVDPAVHHLFMGDDADSDYDVAVDLAYTEDDFKVWGTITVVNPNPSAVMNVAVADALNDLTPITLACSGVLAVPAGSSATCDYTGTPDGRTATLNTATVTFASIGFPATAGISFTVEDVNGYPEINVDDTVEGDLGSATDDHTFEYTNNFECPTNVELYTDGQYDFVVDNTATIVETGDDDDASVHVYCYAPVVTKDATATFSTTRSWTIDKVANPTAISMFEGDTHDVQYTITLDKTVIEAGYYVSGTINVVNNHPTAVMNVAVADVLDDGTPVTLDCGGSLAVPAADDMDCDYSASPSDGSATLNTATVTFNSIGFPATYPIVFSTDPTGFDEVNVTDTNGGSWGPFDDDDVIQYTMEYACDADEGDNGNIATITETGDDDDANVAVTCYDIEVTKDADESYTRTWDWAIDKWAEPREGGDPVSSLNLAPGETYLLTYYVSVDLADAYVDSDWHVEGDIQVHNLALIPAVIASVSDLITAGGIDGNPDCGVTFPYTLAAGATLECSYAADLPDPADRLNTATAALQNYDYDYLGVGVADGTTDYDGTADVAFGEPTLLVDECTDVTDSQSPNPPLPAQVCYDDTLPAVFEYDIDVPVTTDDCGEFTIDNTATETEIDTAEEHSALWSILVTVNCPEGCTLTQGYWKTHNVEFWGGAPPDDNWANVSVYFPDGDLPTEVAEDELEDFFMSGDTWFGVFWTAPKGNAYYNLAHQWMAAWLNCVNATDTPDCSSVQDVLDDAQDWLELNGPAVVGSGKGKDKDKELAAQLTDWAGTLADFNEGEIGPGHCDENDASLFSGKVAVNPAGSVEAAVSLGGVSEAPSESKGAADVKAVAADEAMIDEVSQVDDVSEIAAAPVEVPSEFAVGNYPNPFNPTTTIQVALPEASQVRVAVYDVLGRMVSLVVDGQLSAGTHSVTFDAGSLPSGVYLYRFEWAGGAITRTMQLLK